MSKIMAGRRKARPVLAGSRVMHVCVHMMVMVMVTMIKHKTLMTIHDGMLQQPLMIKAIGNDGTEATITTKMCDETLGIQAMNVPPVITGDGDVKR